MLVRRLSLVVAFALTACSVEHPTFTGMGDAAVGDGGPEIDAPPGTAILTVTRAGGATGAVTSNPGGIDCGTTCSAAFATGTMVTLTATPDAGAAFAGWSGACAGTAATCVVTVDAATAVTATFAVAQYPVTIALGGSGTGTVMAPSAGLNCPGACTAMIAHGSQLSLTAAVGANSLFVGWTVAGAATPCSGTGVCTTTITGPTTITGTFALNQSLEVTRAGNGNGTVTSNPTGINCGVDCSEQYPPATMVTLTASPAGDSTFTGWSGACTGTGPCTVVVNGATLVTATFTLRQFTLTVQKTGTGGGNVSSSPGGIACGGVCAAAFNAGSVVTLTAAPVAGSSFAGWSGGGCSGTAPCQVTIAAPTTVTAMFNPILHTLTVTRTGAGAVTSTPTGIACGADCSEDFAQGTAVTLTAAPSPGATFLGWGGACSGTGGCTVTMTNPIGVTATFSTVQATLTVTRSGTGTGTVSSSPAGIACGGDCSEPYTVGTVVTLSASPDAGNTFAGWSGGGCTGTGSCVVTMNAVTAVTATFTQNTYTLTVNRSGNGTVSSSVGGISCGGACSAVYGHGTAVTLSAAPATNHTFDGWGGACSGTGACVVTMTGNVTVSASFSPIVHTVSIMNSGGGTVASSPGGISCGGACTAAFTQGTGLTLTATPDAGYTFAGWGGAGPSLGCTSNPTCNVTVNADLALTASFTAITYTVQVSRVGGGVNSRVTSNPAGINCGSTCAMTVPYGQAITLTATLASGSWFFSYWDGDCTGQGNVCSLTITADSSSTANFEIDSCPLCRVVGAPPEPTPLGLLQAVPRFRTGSRR